MGLLLLLRKRSRTILDQYPASVAFSLRRLGVESRCVRIRRSSDSAETDIGYTSSGLVDTAAIASFCGSGSGFVRTWYDANGVGHAQQATASLQPRIFASGVQEVNEFGKPCLRFLDATAATVGMHLEIDPWHTASQSYVGHFSAYSLESAGNFTQLLGSNPVDRGFVLIHNGTTRETRAGTVRSVSTFGNGTALTLSRTTIRHGCCDRTNIKTFIDKGVSATMTIADSNTNFVLPTKYWLGSTNDTTTVTADIKLSEFIGYVVDQSSNQLAIRTNMFDFWRS